MSLGLKECILLDNVVFLGIHVMKVAGILPFCILHFCHTCSFLQCGAGSTVPREGFDSSVIMPLSWCVVTVTLPMLCRSTSSVSLHIYTFVVSQAFMAGAASQAGDADSSRAPGLTSGLQGSMNIHRGALLLVLQ